MDTHRHIIYLDSASAMQLEECLLNIADFLGLYGVGVECLPLEDGGIVFYFELAEEDREFFLKNIPLMP